MIGFNCPEYGKVLHAKCKTCSTDETRHRCQYSAAILDKMRGESDPEREGMYSPTQLLGCHRQQILMGQGDHYANPDDLWAMQRGSIVHEGLKHYEYPGALWTIEEIRMWMWIETKYGRMKFGGKPDLIVCKANGKLKIVDWKTTSTLDHSTQPYAGYTAQINMYRTLVMSDPFNIYDKKVFANPVEVDEMELVIIGNRAKRFDSLYELKARGKMLDRSTKEYEQITLEKIKCIPLEEMIIHVRDLIEKRIEAESVLPPILPEEEQWKCRSCPVRKVCFGYE